MINKLTLLGRVGKKDFRLAKNGSKLCTLNVATNERYIDSRGQTKVISNWHMVHLFDKLAEIADKYTNVGDLVYVEAKLNNKKIMEEDGKTRIIQMIVANNIQFIPTGKKEAPTGQDNENKESSNEKSTTNEYYMNNSGKDDIGF